MRNFLNGSHYLKMKVLVIAPHPDDEVLGCGGTIAKYAKQGAEVFVAIVTKGMKPIFSEERTEITRQYCKDADAMLGVKETIFMDFPASMIETVPRYQFNSAFDTLIQRINPDIVFLPHRGDMQLDHKLVVDAAMVALRPKHDHVVKKILMYETLSETGWDIPNTTNEFIPNAYEDISYFLDHKLHALSYFNMQMESFPNSRSLEAVKALALYRGATMRLHAAEAFSLVREIN